MVERRPLDITVAPREERRAAADRLDAVRQHEEGMSDAARSGNQAITDVGIEDDIRRNELRWEA